ncbi:MAG: hypothetical protein KGL46_08350 [Hyphomicrobiales bacterium]|nr:hypothetical protein [Hyphomicrobiales bacterium]
MTGAAILRLAACLLAFCAGAARARNVCEGEPLPVVARGDDPTPRVLLDVDGRRDMFLLDTGATQSTLWAPSAGPTRSASLGLPNVQQADFLQRSGARHAARGVIGADVIARFVLQLSPGEAYAAPACAEGKLRAAGFAPIAQTGFFARAAAGARPNVPVVFVSLAGIRAYAQIDTGYDDRLLAPTIEINPAFLAALRAAHAPLVAAGKVKVATCAGPQSRGVFTSAAPLDITSEEGAPLRRIARYNIVVKSDAACGGVGAMAEPAAQLGASFLRIFGATVFDAGGGRVWIKRQ